MRFDRTSNSLERRPLKRRLKTKPLIVLIGILLLGNVLWFIGWLIPNKSAPAVTEEVASVDGKSITREQWMTEMEKQIGREVLRDLVNEQVMEAAAKKYGITVTDDEIDLELALIASVEGTAHSGLDGETTRQKIRANLILEKVLTKDVVVEDAEIQAYYDENASLYAVQTAYRTAVIYAKTKEEIEQAEEELKNGSSFEVLAKERSTDLASASLGGDIGFINEQTEFVDKAILQSAMDLKQGEASGAIQLQDGTYALVRVVDILQGREFLLKEVKEHIQREIALEQLPESVSPEALWTDFNAHWFYGK